MGVTEYERHQLFAWFEEHLGPERAATMMNLMPPVGWSEFATKDDLAQLEGRLDARLDGKLGSLRSELMRAFATLLFASQATVVAIVGLLISLQ